MKFTKHKNYFAIKKKNQMGCRAYYPRMYHMFEYLRFEKKTLFDVEYYRQINIINLLNDDCNLEGFSFKHL